MLSLRLDDPRENTTNIESCLKCGKIIMSENRKKLRGGKNVLIENLHKRYRQGYSCGR